MLNIDDKKQEFRILESNNSSDSLEDDFSSPFDSCYQSANDSSDSPNIKIGSRSSCSNVIKTNVLTKSKEDKPLEKFNKKKSKELTVNDLQHEINIVKQEICELKHDFKDIKSDNNNLKRGHEHKDGNEPSQ